ncbi:MAG: sugar transferase [Acutalibacteraceae bacterium]
MASPLVFFVYNRADHCKQVIQALKDCTLANETDLYIFSDGPKNEKQTEKVNRVREYLAKIDKSYFKSVTVTQAPVNKGLANSVIGAVGEIIRKYGRVIVIEDDSVPSANFLSYMNFCLDEYRNDSRVWAIGGYLIPFILPDDFKQDVFLSLRGSSCAWATWSDRWELIDWDCKYYRDFKNNIFKRRAFNRAGKDLSLMLDRQMQHKIDSWAIRFAFARYQNNKYWVMPRVSKIYNIGFDNSGTHSGLTDRYDSVTVDKGNEKQNWAGAEFNEEISRLLLKNYDMSLLSRAKVYIKTNFLHR